jgi:hypothetical protein
VCTTCRLKLARRKGRFHYVTSLTREPSAPGVSHRPNHLLASARPHREAQNGGLFASRPKRRAIAPHFRMPHHSFATRGRQVVCDCGWWFAPGGRPPCLFGFTRTRPALRPVENANRQRVEVRVVRAPCAGTRYANGRHTMATNQGPWAVRENHFAGPAPRQVRPHLDVHAALGPMHAGDRN